MIRYGQPYGSQRKSTNSFEIKEGVLYITTKNNDVILADPEDYEKLSKHSWCISKTGYPVANINGRPTKLHRYILELSDPKDIVDHKNRNPLDNRRQNLRRCTQAENMRNKSGKNGYIGIRVTPYKTYNVRITINYKEIYVGSFKTLEEAIAARNKAEDEYHGEFGNHQEGEGL